MELNLRIIHIWKRLFAEVWSLSICAFTRKGNSPGRQSVRASRLCVFAVRRKVAFRIHGRVLRLLPGISELRFGLHCWPADGGGMMCSASQDWKLSSDSTTLTKPFAIT